jgi:hypothetical protein
MKGKGNCVIHMRGGNVTRSSFCVPITLPMSVVYGEGRVPGTTMGASAVTAVPRDRTSATQSTPSSIAATPQRSLVLYDTQCRTEAGQEIATCDALPYFDRLVYTVQVTTPSEFAAQLPSDVKLTVEQVAAGMYWYWYEFADGSKIYARFGEKP